MKTRKRATTTGEVEKNNDKNFYVETTACNSVNKSK